MEIINATKSISTPISTDVMEGHGMSVDYRHIMLLASQMTARGEVLGMNRIKNLSLCNFTLIRLRNHSSRFGKDT